MAKLDTPSVTALYESFISDYRSRTGQTTPILLSAFIRSIAWAHAGITVLLYRLGQWIYFQMFLDTCSFEALQTYGDRVSLPYKDGENCVAVLRVSQIGGTVTTIGSGTIFVDSAGTTYQATSDATVTNGVADVTISCTKAGDAYNVQIGDYLIFSNPPSPDVPDGGYIDSVTVEGADPETEEDYRARVKLRYRSRATGGSPYDYYQWATEVDGIGSAFVYVTKPGITIVYAATDDSQADRAPSTTLLTQVESSIRQSPDSTVYDRHPVQAELDVRSVLFRDYSVEITGLDTSADTSENREAVKNALIGYFDDRKPQVTGLGFGVEGATVSDSGATYAAMNTLVNSTTPGTFQDLTVSPGTSGKDTLPVGTLANLTSLTINSVPVVI